MGTHVYFPPQGLQSSVVPHELIMSCVSYGFLKVDVVIQVLWIASPFLAEGAVFQMLGDTRQMLTGPHLASNGSAVLRTPVMSRISFTTCQQHATCGIQDGHKPGVCQQRKMCAGVCMHLESNSARICGSVSRAGHDVKLSYIGVPLYEMYGAAAMTRAESRESPCPYGSAPNSSHDAS